MNHAAIDPHVFDELQATAGADFVADLVDTFAAEAPPLMRGLRRAWTENDAERFRRSAHSIKSNAETFGAHGMASLARALELGGLPKDAHGIDALEAALTPTLDALRAMARA